MSNIQGRFVASHNGNGHWTFLDQDSGNLLFNVTPVGYRGDLGETEGLVTLTTAEITDLIHVLTVAAEGIKLGGWE